MVNVFDTLTHYQQNYDVVEEREFNTVEKSSIKSAEVVLGSYGKPSVCFHLHAGGVVYIETDKDSYLEVGDQVDVENLIYRKIKKPSETKTLDRVIEKQ